MPKSTTGTRWSCVISVRVTEDTKKRFQSHSKEERQTMSEALRAYLEDMMSGWKK